jgi:response regulator of citrate/malate metabolism
MRSYDRGVNAFLVKPVDFQQFHEALKTLGVFWAVVNDLPLVKST